MWYTSLHTVFLKNETLYQQHEVIWIDHIMHFQKMEKHNVEYNCADKTN